MPVQNNRQSIRYVFISGQCQWRDGKRMDQKVLPHWSTLHDVSRQITSSYYPDVLLESLPEVFRKVAPHAVDVRASVARIVVFQQKGGTLQAIIVRLLRLERPGPG